VLHELAHLGESVGHEGHDDRLDALSIACNYWVEQMAQDADDKISTRKVDLLNKELDNFKNIYYGRKNKNTSSWM